MKIVHIIDSLGRGGAETLLVNTVLGLPEYDHYIITLFERNDFERELEGQLHVQFHSMKAKRIKQFPFLIPRLRKMIKKINPDIVHSQLYWSSVLARIATPKAIKFFFTNQCLQSQEAFKHKWTVLIEKATYFKRHTLVCVSKTVEDEYQQYIGFKGQHYVLRNFADDAFFNLSNKSFEGKATYQFVTVGRLHPQKNYFFLIEAFAKLSHNFTLSIYGKGDLETALKEKVKELSASNIFFNGVQREMYNVLQQYDVFVMASLYEGFSLAVVEAMASGLPVILPDLPVFHEMAEDAAVYFDINNPSDLSAKIVATCQPERLKILSQRCVLQANRIGRKSDFLKKLKTLYES